MIRTHECYLDQGLLVKDAKLLRKNYRSRNIFYLDIISVLPTDLGKPSIKPLK
jgi:hypothetical protein